MTSLIQVIGDESWRDLQRWHDQTLRGLFEQHDGREVDHAGDGFFVSFEDPAAALRCAIAIQRKLVEHRRVAGFAPQVRIGLHAGEALAVDRDFTGRSVHQAARIGALAWAARFWRASRRSNGPVRGSRAATGATSLSRDSPRRSRSPPLCGASNPLTSRLSWVRSAATMCSRALAASQLRRPLLHVCCRGQAPSEEEEVREVTVDVERLREEVQRKYVEVIEHPEGEFHFHTGRRAARNNGYRDALLETLPEEAVAAYAGVANPFHWGLPNPGERVVDVGSGAGTDALIAAQAVGPEGHVIGIDMTPEMLEQARSAAVTARLTNVEFREGLAERLPLEKGWADLVISNGVINLVPDKLGAYRQIARALRAGGRVQVADICVERFIPESALRDIDLWTG